MPSLSAQSVYFRSTWLASQSYHVLFFLYIYKAREPHLWFLSIHLRYSWYITEEREEINQVMEISRKIFLAVFLVQLLGVATGTCSMHAVHFSLLFTSIYVQQKMKIENSKWSNLYCLRGMCAEIGPVMAADAQQMCEWCNLWCLQVGIYFEEPTCTIDETSLANGHWCKCKA
jgi:hypothetical protein